MPRDPNVPTLRHSGYPVGMTRPAPRSGAFHPLLAVAALAVSLAASAFIATPGVRAESRSATCRPRRPA